jgi:glycosyltransferase involved in cell wall biosynthesis
VTQLVSVIIPTYNRAWSIERAIDSALAQSHTAMEVVVVNDGSTDATAEILARRYGEDRRVKIIEQANSGVTIARNRALAEASGDYIAFLDSDDVWKPFKIELQLACLAAFPDIGMVWTDMEAVDPRGVVVDPAYLRKMYGGSYRYFTNADLFDDHRILPYCGGGVAAYAGDIHSPMLMGNLVHTPTVLMTRRRFEQVGLFDLELRHAGEDYDYHLRTCREGRVAFVDVATIQYQVGMGDQLSKRSRAMAQGFLYTIQKAVAADGDRIRLPAWMLDDVFARAHAWVAEVMVDEGERAAARRHYVLSLRHWPWQFRALSQLALCTLPLGVDHAVREVYRRLKRMQDQQRAQADDVEG